MLTTTNVVVSAATVSTLMLAIQLGTKRQPSPYEAVTAFAVMLLVISHSKSSR